MTRSSGETPLCGGSAPSDPARKSLVIGVINNMPQSAFQATSDQFDRLLNSALPDRTDLVLRFFSPADHPGHQSAAKPLELRPEPAQQLWTSSLDGLIVTGAEPQADHIAQEHCYHFLRETLDWIEANELPTIWSCLSAHAAVHLLDGIERQQREAKLFGVFECTKSMPHALLDGSGEVWTVPHSRANDLRHSDLMTHGYQVLSHSPDVGPDTFFKQVRAPHLFLNGHPEYGAATLRSELRRDVRRFLVGEREQFPELPKGYFSKQTILEFAAFREKALSQRTLDIMSSFPADTPTEMPWRNSAIGLFRNWLSGLARQKHERITKLDGIDEIQLQSGYRQLSPLQNGNPISSHLRDNWQLGQQAQ